MNWSGQDVTFPTTDLNKEIWILCEIEALTQKIILSSLSFNFTAKAKIKIKNIKNEKHETQNEQKWKYIVETQQLNSSKKKSSNELLI